MITKIIQSTALVLVAGLAAVPSISQAASSQAQNPVKITYQTSLETIPGPSAPWTGSMQLTISPNGIIQGWYHPAYDMTSLIPVTGGRNGDNVWLDIGTRARLHVSGTMNNKAINGSAIDNTTHKLFTFSAKA